VGGDDVRRAGAVSAARPPRVVVVGGGITGLAAAHRLIEGAVSGGASAQIVVLEAGDSPGGHVRTERHGDFLLEAGPDTLLTQKPWGVSLCSRLRPDVEIEDIGASHPRTQVVRRGRLVHIPDGFLMMAPTRVGPLLGSPLFSWRGKLRILAEPLVPRRPAGRDDESLASFVRRRFGREALERVAEPFGAALYMADAERLGLRATMPRFLDLETREGSVSRALRRAARSSRPFGHGSGRSAFCTVRGGLGRLVDALVARLPSGGLRTRARVQGIERGPGTWRVRLENGESLEADAVLLACPAFESARLLHDTDPALSEELQHLEFASCATVNLAFSRGDVRVPEASFGFFVPRVENLPILACSYASEKFPERAPANTVVLRAFVGGATRPDAGSGDDAELVGRTVAVLRGLLGIRGEPVLARVHRFPRAMPQYGVGASAWLQRIGERTAAYAGLDLAGSARGAVGIPDCVRSGEEAADRIAAGLASARMAARVSA
jgi:protoporphyrinogen/coproporphyrinogen III oxidase